MPIDETAPEQVQDPNIDRLINERNAWLEQALNPDGRLPQASVILLDGNMQRCDKTLPQDPPFEGNSGSLYLRIPESEVAVADMVFGQDPSLPGKLISTDVSALASFRGRGLGKRLYLEGLKALPLGYGLVAHSMHDPAGGGDRMWEWLIECGVARERNEPVQGQIGRYETIF